MSNNFRARQEEKELERSSYHQSIYSNLTCAKKKKKEGGVKRTLQKSQLFVELMTVALLPGHSELYSLV